MSFLFNIDIKRGYHTYLSVSELSVTTLFTTLQQSTNINICHTYSPQNFSVFNKCSCNFLLVFAFIIQMNMSLSNIECFTLLTQKSEVVVHPFLHLKHTCIQHILLYNTDINATLRATVVMLIIETRCYKKTQIQVFDDGKEMEKAEASLYRLLYSFEVRKKTRIQIRS